MRVVINTCLHEVGKGQLRRVVLNEQRTDTGDRVLNTLYLRLLQELFQSVRVHAQIEI